MPDMETPIQASMSATKRFPAPEAFTAQANVKDPAIYAKAAEDREAFWESFANELDWFEPWNKVLDWKAPDAKWFVDGKINASYNCLDRHLETRGDKPAIIWEGEPVDEIRTLTYKDLHEEVNKFANGLKKLGVQKGDRVTMYMPMVPELAIAMLACARIGAPHNVVFAGFSPTALAQRMDDSDSKVLLTVDGYYRKGKVFNQKANADEGVGLTTETTVEHVVVLERIGGMDQPFVEGRDVTWADLVADVDPVCEPEPMDAEDMLFMMYTSGTTGKPKGIVHTTGGYLTGTYATYKYIFDAKEDDVYWCTADIGWITGHSYIVYGPLLNGVTQVMYEGLPTYPEPDRSWDIIERHKVNVLYTAPTAIRAFMKDGDDWVKKHDLSSLRLLGSVGEPINPKAWEWYHEVVGGGNCPIVDTWWQTETGSVLITPLPGITNLKPGSAQTPFPGIEAAILDEDGKELPNGSGGYLAVKTPWPSMLRTIWKDHDRYVDTYWSKWDGIYYPGDGAETDEDGDFWVLGRVDDVMNVSGHRLSTMEIESALVGHESVAEAAVVGAPDDLKGQVPVAFVILKGGYEDSEENIKGMVATVRKDIGPIATPARIMVVPDLPKTRSGKIMRRLLKNIVAGKELGDTTTLRDPQIPHLIAEKY